MGALKPEQQAGLRLALDSVGTPGANSGQAGARRAGPAHIAILDIVRGLAALTVAFYHIREVLWVGIRAYFGNSPTFSLAWIVSAATFPFIWGSIGVPIFFVLSGYVIHRRAAFDLAQGRPSNFAARPFLVRRFIRIYPTFLAALFLSLSLDLASQSLVPDHYKLGDMSLAAFCWNVLGLQGVFSPAFGSNGALWTLALEVQFYLVYPLALVLRRRIGAYRMLLFAVLLSIGGYFTLELRNMQAFPSYYIAWWLGAYVADREAAGSRAIPGWRYLAAAFIAAGCIMTLLHWTYFEHVAWAIGFALLLPAIIRVGLTLSNGPSVRVLSFFGAYSYSLYAVHLPIVVFLSALWLGGSRSPSIFVALAGFVIVLVLGWLFYLIAERPFVKLLKRLR